VRKNPRRKRRKKEDLREKGENKKIHKRKRKNT